VIVSSTVSARPCSHASANAAPSSCVRIVVRVLSFIRASHGRKLIPVRSHQSLRARQDSGRCLSSPLGGKEAGEAAEAQRDLAQLAQVMECDREPEPMWGQRCHLNTVGPDRNDEIPDVPVEHFPGADKVWCRIGVGSDRLTESIILGSIYREYGLLVRGRGRRG
jgi:hypothetical protein